MPGTAERAESQALDDAGDTPAGRTRDNAGMEIEQLEQIAAVIVTAGLVAGNFLMFTPWRNGEDPRRPQPESAVPHHFRTNRTGHLAKTADLNKTTSMERQKPQRMQLTSKNTNQPGSLWGMHPQTSSDQKQNSFDLDSNQSKPDDSLH